MKYRLTYYTARYAPVTGSGTPGESIPRIDVGCFSEEVEKDQILQRMKTLEKQHNETVKYYRNLPQSITFFPIETI